MIYGTVRPMSEIIMIEFFSGIPSWYDTGILIYSHKIPEATFTCAHV